MSPPGRGSPLLSLVDGSYILPFRGGIRIWNSSWSYTNDLLYSIHVCEDALSYFLQFFSKNDTIGSFQMMTGILYITKSSPVYTWLLHASWVIRSQVDILVCQFTPLCVSIGALWPLVNASHFHSECKQTPTSFLFTMTKCVYIFVPVTCRGHITLY